MSQQLQTTSILHSEAISAPCLSKEAQAVRDALVGRGLETPMKENALSRDQKVDRIEELMTQVAETLGLDLKDDSLTETPERIARMYVDELFSGLDYSAFPKITQIDNKMGVEEMIKVRDIGLISTCEHHFVTIDGVARVAYMPKNKVIGLSKINRIVRFFARRPQVQERLTHQILVALQTLLEVEDVAVHIDATHYCVKARGVMDGGSRTETIALGGRFKTESGCRAEFMG
ncbi:MAG: GTP cyclohydrolase I FolE [Alteromonadaceae bacterium]|nr:GTP cyclohydrolase I FolE [Alteromonadaceae bacterium]MBH85492.1 GTP cyclohydrolase I FolE [Alteromonadaceae bacterium]|tara:strand:- start:46978 stop:47673 length:696 start_codon:yes stop_codon:yes gene_type:complete